ncbi:uncharacterized protein LOC141596646 [Silene latifolia]|uniref:uncharacterized protein LOC141596646 n=1 Tax=Silene latifolia TaxID=37657 RepID=UPI003D770BE3
MTMTMMMRMMMDDGDRSGEDIPELINIFTEAVSMLSAESSFVHFHGESQIRRPLSYFQADRHPVEDSLLQLCAKDHIPWIKQLDKDSELPHVQDAIKKGVVWVLSYNLKEPFCLKVQKLSKAVDDFEFYHSAITAAAILVYSFYPKHLLFKLGNRQLLERQMNYLWDQFTIWWNKGLPFDEVCKLLVHEIGKDKYSFITEYDVILLLTYYYNQCREGVLLHPSPLYGVSSDEEETDTIVSSDEEEDDEEKETAIILHDIKAVVDKIRILDIPKDDDYTRLLIKNFRRDDVTENETSPNIYEPSFADVLKTVYNTNFQNSCWLPYLSKEGLSWKDIIRFFECGLLNVSKSMMQLLQDHLPYAVQPLFSLCYTKSLELSPEVCEVIQVAEIRRIALGSRFISQKHLLWAFYECGYGLPDNLEATINSADEEHPPYHIYVASVKLAVLSEEKVVQLQHFVFAILRWDLIGDGEEVSGMLADFRVYMKVLDGIKKTKAASEGIIENDVEEAGRDDVSYQFMEKNKKRRIEMAKPEGAMSSDLY